MQHATPQCTAMSLCHGQASIDAAARLRASLERCASRACPFRCPMLSNSHALATVSCPQARKSQTESAERLFTASRLPPGFYFWHQVKGVLHQPCCGHRGLGDHCPRHSTPVLQPMQSRCGTLLMPRPTPEVFPDRISGSTRVPRKRKAGSRKLEFASTARQAGERKPTYQLPPVHGRAHQVGSTAAAQRGGEDLETRSVADEQNKWISSAGLGRIKIKPSPCHASPRRTTPRQASPPRPLKSPPAQSRPPRCPAGT
jgi:hypothetical protein